MLTSRPSRADDEPWKQGVSQERQDGAHKLLDEGNNELLQRNYSAALAKYNAALDVWDHPAIRFNMVRALVGLERFVEAYENLQLALKYGAAPLQDTVYAEALAYQDQLAKQIATISISCAQDDVQVTLDGQPILTCPGKQVRHVLAGHHQLVGKQSRYLTRTIEIDAHGGESQERDLSLDPIRTAPSAWTTKRIIAVGLGTVAVASLGTGIALGVAAQNRQSDAHALCDDTAVPCDGALRANELIRSGHRLAIEANVLFGVSALAMIGGTVLWLRGGPASQDGVAIAPSRHGIVLVGHF